MTPRLPQAVITTTRVDLWRGRLALEMLRLDQREAIEESWEGEAGFCFVALLPRLLPDKAEGLSWCQLSPSFYWLRGQDSNLRHGG